MTRKRTAKLGAALAAGFVALTLPGSAFAANANVFQPAFHDNCNDISTAVCEIGPAFIALGDYYIDFNLNYAPPGAFVHVQLEGTDCQMDYLTDANGHAAGTRPCTVPNSSSSQKMFGKLTRGGTGKWNLDWRPV